MGSGSKFLSGHCDVVPAGVGVPWRLVGGVPLLPPVRLPARSLMGGALGGYPRSSCVCGLAFIPLAGSPHRSADACLVLCVGLGFWVTLLGAVAFPWGCPFLTPAVCLAHPGRGGWGCVGCLGGDWVDLGVSLSGDVGIWFLALAAVSLLACGVGDGLPSGCKGLRTSHVA